MAVRELWDKSTETRHTAVPGPVIVSVSYKGEFKLVVGGIARFTTACVVGRRTSVCCVIQGADVAISFAIWIYTEQNYVVEKCNA